MRTGIVSSSFQTGMTIETSGLPVIKLVATIASIGNFYSCGYTKGLASFSESSELLVLFGCGRLDVVRHRGDIRAKRIAIHTTAATLLKTRANLPSGERL